MAMVMAASNEDELLDELLTAQEVKDLKLLPYHPRTLMDFARTDRIDCIRLSPRKIRFTRRIIADFKRAGYQSAKPAETKPARNPKYATSK